MLVTRSIIARLIDLSQYGAMITQRVRPTAFLIEIVYSATTVFPHRAGTALLKDTL